MNREKFDKSLNSPSAFFHYEFLRSGFPYFTYIAVSEDGNVYKIGRSRNPIKRQNTFKGGYRHFRFRVVFFIDRNIEYEILNALYYAGVNSPLPKYLRRPEAFYLSEDDIKYIVEKFGFKPISDFKEYEHKIVWVAARKKKEELPSAKKIDEE